MTEGNSINYHEIIYNLKLFRNESKNINSISEWEIFFAKLNKYIFSNCFLRNLYINSVNTFAKLKEESKIFTNELIKNYINYETSNDSWFSINYFELKTPDISHNIFNNSFYNIFDMYFKISNNSIKNTKNCSFIWKYQKLINNLDCYILACISKNNLFF